MGETIWKRDKKSVEIVEKGRNEKRKELKCKIYSSGGLQKHCGKGWIQRKYWHIAVSLEEEPGEESKMYDFKTKI